MFYIHWLALILIIAVGLSIFMLAKLFPIERKSPKQTYKKTYK